jgi:CMP-N-acetylneuraminic acid synthetase
MFEMFEMFGKENIDIDEEIDFEMSKLYLNI